ncbi:hypothetical protein QYM36_010808, partial [Artemia franciscana]
MKTPLPLEISSRDEISRSSSSNEEKTPLSVPNSPVDPNPRKSKNEERLKRPIRGSAKRSLANNVTSPEPAPSGRGDSSNVAGQTTSSCRWDSSSDSDVEVVAILSSKQERTPVPIDINSDEETPIFVPTSLVDLNPPKSKNGERLKRPMRQQLNGAGSSSSLTVGGSSGSLWCRIQSSVSSDESSAKRTYPKADYDSSDPEFEPNLKMINPRPLKISSRDEISRSSSSDEEKKKKKDVKDQGMNDLIGRNRENIRSIKGKRVRKKTRKEKIQKVIEDVITLLQALLVEVLRSPAPSGRGDNSYFAGQTTPFCRWDSSSDSDVEVVAILSSKQERTPVLIDINFNEETPIFVPTSPFDPNPPKSKNGERLKRPMRQQLNGAGSSSSLTVGGSSGSLWRRIQSSVSSDESSAKRTYPKADYDSSDPEFEPNLKMINPRPLKISSRDGISRSSSSGEEKKKKKDVKDQGMNDLIGRNRENIRSIKGKRRSVSSDESSAKKFRKRSYRKADYDSSDSEFEPNHKMKSPPPLKISSRDEISRSSPSDEENKKNKRRKRSRDERSDRKKSGKHKKHKRKK